MADDMRCPEEHYATCCGCGEVWHVAHMDLPLHRGFAWMCSDCAARSMSASIEQVGPRIELPFPVMTEAGFPHGLRCDSCRRVIGVGQPYREDVESIYDNGDTMAVLRCVYCSSVTEGSHA